MANERSSPASPITTATTPSGPPAPVTSACRRQQPLSLELAQGVRRPEDEQRPAGVGARARTLPAAEAPLM
jgi:hypothetical protein